MDHVQFQLTLSPKQLYAASLALTVFDRLCTGDLWILERLMKQEVIVGFASAQEARRLVDEETRAASVIPILRRMRTLLGYLGDTQMQPHHAHSAGAKTAAQIHNAIVFDPSEAASGHLVLSAPRAYAMVEALDVYTRLCLGQFGILSEMVLSGHANMHAEPGTEPGRLSASDAWEQFDPAATDLKRVLGFPAHGSFGIGHKHVHESAHCAWEIKKVLARELALERDRTSPVPETMRGVDHDGLIVRYTDDPAPIVKRLEAEGSGETETPVRSNNRPAN